MDDPPASSLLTVDQGSRKIMLYGWLLVCLELQIYVVNQMNVVWEVATTLGLEVFPLTDRWVGLLHVINN